MRRGVVTAKEQAVDAVREAWRKMGWTPSAEVPAYYVDAMAGVYEPLLQECYGALAAVSGREGFDASAVRDLAYKVHRALGLPCPNDTDGDGDCGQRACPFCGDGIR